MTRAKSVKCPHTGWMAGVRLPAGATTRPFTTPPIQPSIKREGQLDVPFPRVQPPKKSPSPKAMLQNVWSYPPTSLRLHGMDLKRTKQRADIWRTEGWLLAVAMVTGLINPFV